jgi:hypothetical protein
MKVEETGAPPGPVQAPPTSGVPFSSPKRSKDEAELHTEMTALVPASGGSLTVTVTVAVASVHGCGEQATV